MSSMCFSTEDIPTEPDRTLRTVGPAGTAPASSTGMFGKDVVPLWVFCIYLSLVSHASTGSAVRVSSHSYVHHAVISTHVSLGSSVFFFFYGLVGLAFCSVWQAQPDCSTLGRATRRTNTAAGLIAERSDESFIKTYHTHTLSCCSLSGLMRWTTTQT